ncbi:MAG: hypothetical protein ABIE70_13170 [bacterium]
MSFCPRCRFEYDAAELICPECHIVLVDRLVNPTTTAAVRPDDSWVVVGGVGNAVESRVAKGSLDSSNIPAMVLPSHLTALSCSTSVVTNRLPSETSQQLIMVPREFHTEAMLILKTVLGEDFGENEMDIY